MYTPKFSITNKVLKNIGEIEAAKEVIENAPIIPTYEKKFQSDAMTRTVHHGTHIEGNDLSMEQTRKVLEGEAVVARARDIQEVINYRNVVELLDELVHKRGGYTVDILLDLQRSSVEKIVPDEKVGALRKTQVIIKNESTGEVILRPPSAAEVPFMVEEFIAWLNDDSAKEIHPVLRAGIAHYILVAIHPFVEGNGRTVRAFSTLVLMKEGYNIKRFFSIEEHFDADPASYYSAFALVDKQSVEIAERDLTTWLEYFTEAVSVELTKIKNQVRKISVDTRLKVKFGEQITLSERQMRIVEFLNDQKEATVPDLRKIIKMVSDDSILRDLKDLIIKGIIKKRGSTKASRYVIVDK